MPLLDEISLRPLKKERAGRYRSADGMWLFIKSPAGEWASHVTWHAYYGDEDEAFGMPSLTLRDQVDEAEAEMRHEARRRGA